MPPSSALEKIAMDAANKKLGNNVVLAVQVSDYDVSAEEALLLFRLVIKPGEVSRLDGDKLLDANSVISRAVEKAGEQKRLVIEYADKDELESLGSHQF